MNDDFAAYIMHAKNLVEGHAYSDIRYIPKSQMRCVAFAVERVSASLPCDFGAGVSDLRSLTFAIFKIATVSLLYWISGGLRRIGSRTRLVGPARLSC